MSSGLVPLSAKESQVWHQVWSLVPSLKPLGQYCTVRYGEQGLCASEPLDGSLGFVFSPTQGQAYGDISGDGCPECVVEWGVGASTLLRDLNNRTVEGAWPCLFPSKPGSLGYLDLSFPPNCSVVTNAHVFFFLLTRAQAQAQQSQAAPAWEPPDSSHGKESRGSTSGTSYSV